MAKRPCHQHFKITRGGGPRSCHRSKEPCCGVSLSASRTPWEVLRLLLLRTPTLTGGFSLPWEPRRYYSSSCSSWSKASAARRGAVSPLCAEILPFSAPLRLVGGVPLLLGPVDGRNISPLSIIMVYFLTFGGVIVGIAWNFEFRWWQRFPKFLPHPTSQFLSKE